MWIPFFLKIGKQQMDNQQNPHHLLEIRPGDRACKALVLKKKMHEALHGMYKLWIPGFSQASGVCWGTWSQAAPSRQLVQMDTEQLGCAASLFFGLL